EADTHAFADLPPGDPGADGVDAAHNLMPRHPRQLQTRIRAADGRGIGVTDAAGLHSNADLAGRRLRDGSFDNLQLARFRHFDRPIRGRLLAGRYRSGGITACEYGGT